MPQWPREAISLYLLNNIFSGLYCTFYNRAGGCRVAPKLNLRHGDYTQVCPHLPPSRSKEAEGGPHSLFAGVA